MVPAIFSLSRNVNNVTMLYLQLHRAMWWVVRYHHIPAILEIETVSETTEIEN